MTTIVWDGKTLAADGRCTKGQMLMSDNITKVHTPEGCYLNDSPVIAFAYAGDADMRDVIYAWLYAGCPLPAEVFEDCEFTSFVITKDTAWIIHGAMNAPLELTWPGAEGSGSPFAMGALALGKNAKQCVSVGCSVDVNSGGQGLYIDCRAKNPKLKEFTP